MPTLTSPSTSRRRRSTRNSSSSVDLIAAVADVNTFVAAQVSRHPEPELTDASDSARSLFPRMGVEHDICREVSFWAIVIIEERAEGRKLRRWIRNPRSTCALFAGLPLLFVVLDVIR